MGNEKYHMQKCINVLVDTLVSLGLQDVVLSPGSRNAPLMLALSRIQNLRIHSVVDERSAGYTALGISMKTGIPSVLVCTSGTAAVNYYPAITEAFYSRVPLLVITADRPHELVDQWAGQCIRQNGLFTNHIRGEFLTTEVYTDQTPFKKAAHDAFQATFSTIPGPVHVNVPLHEPLYHAGPAQLKSLRISNDNATNINRIEKPETDLIRLATEILPRFEKVLVITGAPESFLTGDQVEGEWPELSGYVLLPDLISGLHAPERLKNWDGFLQSRWDKLAHLQPDLLISVGTHCLSKGLHRFLQKFGPKRQIHVSRYENPGNPFGTSLISISGDYAGLVKTLATVPKNNAYREAWEIEVQKWNHEFEKLPWANYNEFTATRFILENIPANRVLHFSNSMPVRYASYLSANNRHKVFANRGTSGIDGCTSTAVGYALKSKEEVVLITGDLAFGYDINALWRKELPASFKMVIMNNRGGGIFDLIDGPSTQPVIEEWQQTPVDIHAKMLSEAYGLTYFRASDFEGLRREFNQWMEIEGPAILEVRTDKISNKSFYSKFTGKEK